MLVLRRGSAKRGRKEYEAIVFLRGVSFKTVSNFLGDLGKIVGYSGNTRYNQIDDNSYILLREGEIIEPECCLLKTRRGKILKFTYQVFDELFYVKNWK